MVRVCVCVCVYVRACVCVCVCSRSRNVPSSRHKFSKFSSILELPDEMTIELTCENFLQLWSRRSPSLNRLKERERGGGSKIRADLEWEAGGGKRLEAGGEVRRENENRNTGCV